MRTKALLCAAALAAGAVTSMAQSNVYSLNVVGYYNLSMQPGFNLVANQLVTGTNGLAQILPNAGQDVQVLKYDATKLDYSVDVFDVGSGGWINGLTGNPSTTTVSPGEGFFYFNPGSAAQAVTFVGEVTQGNNLTVSIPANYKMMSSVIPQAVSLVASNGFTAVQDMQYLSYNAAIQNYDAPIVYDVGSGGWINGLTGNPSMPTPAVGQGFFIFNPDNVNHDWVRSFTVQ